jgi:hypothetical protein
MGSCWSQKNPSYPTDQQLKWSVFATHGHTKMQDTDPEMMKRICLSVDEKSEAKQFACRGVRWQLYAGLSLASLHLALTHPHIPIIIYQGGWTQKGKPTPDRIYKCVIKNKLLTFNSPKDMVIISVDCPYDDPIKQRRGMNFCQPQDVYSITRTIDVLNQYKTQNPIILVGGSKGALNILHALADMGKESIEQKQTDRLDRITGAIIESPPLSLESALSQQIGGGWVTPFIHWWCPNLIPHASDIRAKTKSFPTWKNIPILFASLPLDTISPLAPLQVWISELRASERNEEEKSGGTLCCKGTSRYTHFILSNDQAKDMKHGSFGTHWLYCSVATVWLTQLLSSKNANTQTSTRAC